MNLIKYAALAAFLGMTVDQVAAVRLNRSPVPGVTFIQIKADDPKVAELKEKIAGLKEELDELEGKVIVPKSEDEEKAELDAATNNLADTAEANERKAEAAKLMDKIATLKKGLEEGENDAGMEADI